MIEPTSGRFTLGAEWTHDAAWKRTNLRALHRDRTGSWFRLPASFELPTPPGGGEPREAKETYASTHSRPSATFSPG